MLPSNCSQGDRTRKTQTWRTWTYQASWRGPRCGGRGSRPRVASARPWPRPWRRSSASWSAPPSWSACHRRGRRPPRPPRARTQATPPAPRPSRGRNSDCSLKCKQGVKLSILPSICLQYHVMLLYLLTWVLAGVAGHGAPVSGAGQAVLPVLLPAVHGLVTVHWCHLVNPGVTPMSGHSRSHIRAGSWPWQSLIRTVATDTGCSPASQGRCLQCTGCTGAGEGRKYLIDTGAATWGLLR